MEKGIKRKIHKGKKERNTQERRIWKSAKR
jgi:hypothetical protein